MTVVLVVDDDTAIRRTVSAGLRARDYEVREAENGEGAVQSVASDPPDLVILDLGLPDIDGVDVCRRIRAWSQVPILVLSAEASDYRKVLALDEGADDYLTKPFSMPELLARVRVALRHRSAAGALDEATELRVGDLLVDLARHRVLVGEREVDLTPKEFDFLALLARWPGRVLTHRAILQEVWGPEYGHETHYLRVYASQIRKKLGAPADARLVTEPGVGYRLSDDA
ncbi:MAG: response regulator transcription factor [Acidimicrobiales bacterium]